MEAWSLWSAINTTASSKLDLPYDHWMNPLETPIFPWVVSLRKPNLFTCSLSSFHVYSKALHDITAQLLARVSTVRSRSSIDQTFRMHWPRSPYVSNGSFLENCLLRVWFARQILARFSVKKKKKVTTFPSNSNEINRKLEIFFHAKIDSGFNTSIILSHNFRIIYNLIVCDIN